MSVRASVHLHQREIVKDYPLQWSAEKSHALPFRDELHLALKQRLARLRVARRICDDSLHAVPAFQRAVITDAFHCRRFSVAGAVVAVVV